MKDALKPIVQVGTKRKLQQAIEEGVRSVAEKRRKIAVPRSIESAIKSVKQHTAAQLTKAKSLGSNVINDAGHPEKVSERALRGQKRSVASVTFSRQGKAAVEPTLAATIRSRNGNAKASASTAKQAIVRTVKRANRNAVSGKSIRVISG